jgi:wyosine [tRNA(Phe)-imidazoG37] synthetase (radical SAM superfamily)
MSDGPCVVKFESFGHRLSRLADAECTSARIRGTKLLPLRILMSDIAEQSNGRLAENAFSWPRNFFDNRFVYTVISPRARGLSIGVNMNPDRFCNFDCVYCEVDREMPALEMKLDLVMMAEELDKALSLVRSGRIREHPAYRGLSNDLLQLRHVALSGDGEPTLCPNFTEAVEVVVHMRARAPHAFFKIALVTNGTGLDLAPVQDGLQYFTSDDEIWVKLDVGTPAYMDRINRSQVPLEKVVANLLLIGRQRPIIIQSLFPLFLGQQPPQEEINSYISLLGNLKKGGARISLVQVYSATRPMAHSDCGHLRLKTLSQICQRIKAETGLRAEVF